ncbi:unnamed protein product [Caenorhabditis nigoni]
MVRKVKKIDTSSSIEMPMAQVDDADDVAEDYVQKSPGKEAEKTVTKTKNRGICKVCKKEKELEKKQKKKERLAKALQKLERENMIGAKKLELLKLELEESDV